MLQVELKEKQAAINNLLDIIKNFAVNENKKDGSREQQPTKIHNKGHNDDIMTELLQIDQLHHQFQKLKDQPNISADTPGILFGVNQICYERNLNESDINWNLRLN